MAIKKALVLGHKGYIGAVLCQQLNCEVVTSESRLEREHFLGDLLKDVDVVFHLAWSNDAYEAQRRPILDLMGTPIGTLRLLEEVSRLERKPLIIFASTVTVFGESRIPIGCAARDNPTTIYDAHKLLVEHYLDAYSTQFGVPSVSIRFANIYGPSPAEPGKNRGFLNKAVQLALKDMPVSIYGDGSGKRDYVYIDDAVAFLIYVANTYHLEGMRKRRFVFATGESYTFLDAMRVLLKYLNFQVKLVPWPDDTLQIEHRSHVFFNDDIVVRSFAMTSLDEGLRKTIEFYKP